MTLEERINQYTDGVSDRMVDYFLPFLEAVAKHANLSVTLEALESCLLYAVMAVDKAEELAAICLTFKLLHKAFQDHLINLMDGDRDVFYHM